MKKQSVVSSILWLAIAEIFFNFSGYVIHAFLGRMLGPADYGRYGLIVTLTTMIIMLIGNGIPTAMSKYISGFFEKQPGLVLNVKKKAAFLQFFLIGFITIIFFLLAPVLSFLLRDPTLTPLFRISSLIIPSFAAASFYLYFYIGIHRFNLQSTLKIVRSFAKIFFIIGLAYFFGLKGSVIGYILSPATVFLTAFFIDWLFIDRQFPKDNQEVFDWKKLINYAWPVTLFMIFYELLISLDLYLVKGVLANDHLTGIYNASLTVGRIPYYLFYALTLVMLPSISRAITQNNHEEAKRIMTQTFRLMFMILVPIIILMVVYATPLIQLFFGSRYADSALPMQILAPGVGFLTIFYIISFALNGAGKVKIPMYVALFGMILNAGLNYVMISRFGISGSAAATSIVSVIITLIILLYAFQYFGSFVEIKKILKILLAGIAMFLASYFFPPQKWIFILWGAILSGVYLFALIILKEFTKNDFDFFKKIIFKKS
ncbi:MAG TPA: flippase [Candidatus Moranbacteria bacterium]|nr:flippase [Candidatus Moranbacteria bacterium]